MSDRIQYVQISCLLNRDNGVSSFFGAEIFFFFKKKKALFSSLFRAAITIGRPLLLSFIDLVKNCNCKIVLPITLLKKDF